jgi:hypothetical protein
MRHRVKFPIFNARSTSSLLSSPVCSMILVFLTAFFNVFDRMVNLMSRKRRPACWSQCVRRQPSRQPPAVLKEEIAREVESTLPEDVGCQFPPSSARYVSSAGWLFAPHRTNHHTPWPSADLPRRSIEGRSATSMFASKSIPRTFQRLPTEIHFKIATYLPDYTIQLLAESDKFDESLRQIYERSDPRGERLEWGRLSHEERCIWYELHTRDIFQRTLFPLELAGLSDTTRMVWDVAKFYCYCCKEVVGLPHFPIRQMVDSIHNRTGMSKITDRKCFAYVMPVQLWTDTVITWERLQEARKELRRPEQHRAVRVLNWNCHPTCHTTKGLCTHKSKLLPSTLDTLTLHRVFPNKVEARAEYFVDLYKPLRFRTANASLIVDLVNEKQPYICPHLDLTQVLHRFMASHPVNFGGQPPSHDPVHTLAEVMVRAMEKKPWEPTPEHRHFIRPLCKIKEQSIWCGFKGNKCRTEVTLQRFRDNERWTVGWMRDLVRLKVVRKWRVDRGTRDKEWQAQNGTSAMASVVVKRKGCEAPRCSLELSPVE